MSACRTPAPPEVRIDESAFVPSPPARSAELKLPPTLKEYPAIGQTLPSMAPPAPPESLGARRRLAVQSIQGQREAVRESLLRTRLAVLTELEPRWRADLRADYETDRLLEERDNARFDAFQAYGRARFSLLVQMVIHPPESEPYRTALQSLQQLEREWQATQRRLDERYRAQLAQIEQEIEVRLRARQRAFVQEVEREVDAAMASEPRAEELYLPPIERLAPAPVFKQTLPPVRVRLSASLQQPDPRGVAQSNAVFAQTTLQQLAEEWARLKGYRLTEAPSAREATREFARFLQR